MSNQITEYVLLGISVFLILIYHLWFVFKLYLKPTDLVTGWTHHIRHEWILETSKKKDSDIIVIQTLRNWIIGAVFLATASITSSFSFLSFYVNGSVL